MNRLTHIPVEACIARVAPMNTTKEAGIRLCGELSSSLDLDKGSRRSS